MRHGHSSPVFYFISFFFFFPQWWWLSGILSLLWPFYSLAPLAHIRFDVLYKFLQMAGDFPKVPALLAACFARCCTAPLCSLIYHCVHLLSLPSLSHCLPLRSQPCCRVLQFYVGPKPALVVCFLPSVIRVYAQICCVVSSARRQWPRPWLRSVSMHNYKIRGHSCQIKIRGYMVLKYTGWVSSSQSMPFRFTC